MRVRTIGYGLLVSALALGGCGGESEESSSGGSGGTAGSGGNAGSGGSAGTAGNAGTAGSSGTAGTGGGSNVPFEDVLGKVVELQCNAINTCADDVIDLYLAGMDCETYFGRGFEDGGWPNMEKAVDEGRVIYHGDKAQACFDAWAALECDMFTTRAPDICEEALEGTVDEGDDCTLDVECKGPLWCKVVDACPGTCSARVGEGSACEEDDACQNGLTCDDDLKECAVPGKAGDSCQGGEPDCLLGLFCVGSEDTTPGTCKEISEVLAGDEGDPCDFTGEWCKLGLSCVLEGWTAAGPEASCKAQVGSGAACGIGIPNQCPAEQYCDADPTTTGVWEGICVPLPEDGEPCVGVDGLPQCKPYHVCDANDVCQEVQRLDGDCAADQECYSGNCDTGKCSPTDVCSNQ